MVSRASSSPQCTGVSSWWPLSLRSRALGSQASVVAAHGLGSLVLRLSSTGSVVTHGLSNSTLCGIFPDQGSNPCPLHWQADTYPRRHQSCPITYLFWGGRNPTYNQAPALHRMCEPGWGLNFIPKVRVATEVGVAKYVLFKNPFSREVGNTSEGSAWTPGVLLRGLFVWGEGLYPSWSHLGDWVNWEAVQKLFQQGAVTANVQFSSGQSLSDWLSQSLSRLWLLGKASLSVADSQSLLKLIIESVMPSSHGVLCRHLLLLPSIFPSIKVFSNESALRIRWPKYWSFSFSLSPSNEYSRLISFRMDWLDLLTVQGTLKSLLQHHGTKASILQHSA